MSVSLSPPPAKRSLPSTYFDESDARSLQLRNPGVPEPQEDLPENDDDIEVFQPSKEADSLVARNLRELSMEDRERVYYDVHGIAEEVEETPELIEACLAEFDRELEQMPDNQAYWMALEKNPAYVRCRNFRLRFLRADRFQASMAATRFSKHFSIKLDLFGEDLLTSDLTQGDLEEDALRSLYDGSGYDLPFRDRAGRLVFIQFSQPASIPARAVMQKIFYTSMVLTEDIETQRKGCVGLSYLVGQALTWKQLARKQEANQRWGETMPGLPIRVEAMHICYDSLLWQSVFAIFKIAASSFQRLRVREHFGNHKEVMFQLQTFGIPTHLLPVSEEGELLTEPAANRWKRRQALERLEKPERKDSETSSQKRPIRIGTPSSNDVLLGRGKSCYMHVGNIRFRNILLSLIEEYDNARHTEKQVVCANLVYQIQQSGGRFLKDDGLGWSVVDDTLAFKKVSHTFRSLRGMKK